MTEEQKQGMKGHIREIFMRNGFTIKDGQSDLKDYVYSAAYELIAALTQPASTALKLPETISVRTAIAALDNASAVTTIAQSYKMAWNSCIAETKRLNAPRTAPIEPISATGGAEWVKVSERMPEECEPVIVVDNGIDVYPAVFSDGKFYEYGDTFTPCLMSNPTHWMPLPAAPTS